MIETAEKLVRRGIRVQVRESLVFHVSPSPPNSVFLLLFFPASPTSASLKNLHKEASCDARSHRGQIRVGVL